MIFWIFSFNNANPLQWEKKTWFETKRHANGFPIKYTIVNKIMFSFYYTNKDNTISLCASFRIAV